MSFVKYSSIENSYRSKEIAEIRRLGFDQVEWVATEKVHGCNFGLHPIDGQVRPSKREGLTDGSFYGCQAVVEELTAKVLAIGLPIYGELFGHGIQKGVAYGEKRFASFDIMRDGEYIPYDEFVSLCDTHGVERCVEIARGSFNELLELDPSFPTRMSACGSQDTAEGFVMKPVTALRFTNGGRVILKKKSPGFSEQTKGPKPKVSVELTEQQQTVFSAAQEYVTQAKLDCVLSKLGEDPPFNDVFAAMLADVLEELGKDEVDLSTFDSLRRPLGNVIGPLIRKSLYS
jgi:Rnl2 family RNA ligase